MHECYVEITLLHHRMHAQTAVMLLTVSQSKGLPLTCCSLHMRSCVIIGFDLDWLLTQVLQLSDCLIWDLTDSQIGRLPNAFVHVLHVHIGYTSCTCTNA